MDYEVVKSTAQQALAAGKYEDALHAASALVEADEPWLIDGLLRRALVLENWECGPSDRLAAAADDWRRLVKIAPASVSFRGLARVSLKLGERDAALVNLLEAKSKALTPEVMLGFAEYYRSASPPDLERAKAHFLRAALRGRTQGMRGYVETALVLNRPFSSAVMTIVSVLATPFIALVLGKRRHDGF